MTDAFSPEAAQRAGHQTFLGLELLVSPGVLVPRAETELLARTAISLLEPARGEERPLTLVDLCCGAGNLTCAIAAHLPGLRVWAVDLLPAAVELTRRNAERLGLADRVSVAAGDLLAPLSGLGLEGSVDAIVCNPPYISTGRLGSDRRELLDHEPREAFDGGPYGLSIHQRVVKDAGSYLRPGGPLLMEIGLGQERQVAALIKRAGTWDEPQLRTDATGAVRVIVATRRRA